MIGGFEKWVSFGWHVPERSEGRGFENVERQNPKVEGMTNFKTGQTTDLEPF